MKKVQLKVLIYLLSGFNFFKDGVVCITGHMMDALTRELARFPDTRENLRKAITAVHNTLDAMHRQSPIKMIVTGGTHGMDLIAIAWAIKNNVMVHQFRPYAQTDFNNNQFTGAGSPTADYWRRVVKAAENSPNVFIHEPRIQGVGRPATQAEIAAAMPDSPYECFTDVNRMLQLMLKYANNPRLLTLNDGQDKEDGPGGTRDMVAKALKYGTACYALKAGLRNCAPDHEYPAGLKLLKS